MVPLQMASALQSNSRLHLLHTFSRLHLLHTFSLLITFSKGLCKQLLDNSSAGNTKAWLRRPWTAARAS